MKVYSPDVTMRVYKRIQRRNGLAQRVTGATREFELRPFLGEGGSVTTSKRVRDPAGSFAMNLVDRQDAARPGADSATLDSLAAFIEPMDYVEIRAAREPHLFAGAELPIVMRGFVSEVKRNRGMGRTGQPTRTVSICGQDYGKLLQIAKILTGPRYTTGQALLSTFRLFVLFGMDIQLKSVNAFVQQVIGNIFNPWLQEMVGVTDARRIPQLGVAVSVREGLIAPYGMQTYEGSIWDLLTQWVDIPWNEVFVDERAAGPTLVVRPTPFMNLAGRPVQPGADVSIGMEVGDSEIVEMVATRSDRDVANYFWIEPPSTELSSRELLVPYAIAGAHPFLENPVNAHPALYGLREMHASTNQMAGGVSKPPQTMTAPDEKSLFASQHSNWMERRRSLLKAMNRDNVLYESGTMKVMGSERFRPGRYVRVHDGALSWTAYVTGVTHSFAAFDAFTTEIEFERGTGFYERTARERAPYLAEAQRGVYEP